MLIKEMIDSLIRKNLCNKKPDRAVGALTVWCIEIEHLTGKCERHAQKE